MIYGHLVLVCALIAAHSGVALVLVALVTLDKKNIKIISVFFVVFILSGIGIIGFRYEAHIQDNKDKVITKAFTSTAHDLFLAIQGKAHNLALASNPTAGEIVLKDSTTVIAQRINAKYPMASVEDKFEHLANPKAINIARRYMSLFGNKAN